MGDIYQDDDYYILGHVDGLNLRFSPGPPLKEMVWLQQEFDIFAEGHKLEDALALLNVTGASWELREKWRKLLAWIGGLDSNQAPTKGGPAIMAMLKTNLESRTPKPVYFKTHNYADEPRVMLNPGGEQPFFYIDQQYLTVSLPLRKKHP